MSTPWWRVVIWFTNGSKDVKPFAHYSDACDLYHDGISYGSGRIARVELHEQNGGVRTIWDHQWDDASKMAAMYYRDR